MLKRIPMKRSGGTLKKSGRIKMKSKSPEKVQEEREIRQKDKEFYQSIWDNRSHECEVHDTEGVWLGYKMKPLFMDHLCEKSIYPELRYEPRNIALCCEDCHRKRTDGFPTTKHYSKILDARRKLL